MACKITGWGKALPARVVTNEDLSQVVDTSDEWIVTRTGISERRIAVEESATELASEACRQALEKANVDPASIDLLICMTITPDAVIPAQACMIKAHLGLVRAVAFDLNAACTGCIYGLEVASALIESSAGAVGAAGTSAAGAGLAAGLLRRNVMRRALVVGVDLLSRLVNWEDRATCVLFGDGAGAALLEWQEGSGGIISSFLKNTDDDELTLGCDRAYDFSTMSFASVDQPNEHRIMGVSPDESIKELVCSEPFSYPFISMQGQRVFKFATSSIVEAINEVCNRAQVSLSDIACIVPHQANERIIRYAAKKLDLPMERFQLSIKNVGNTSASSVLMALNDAYTAGCIKSGDKVILVGFGGGLTAGAILFEA